MREGPPSPRSDPAQPALDLEQAWRRFASTHRFSAALVARGLAEELGEDLALRGHAAECHADFFCRLLADEAVVNRAGSEQVAMLPCLARDRFLPSQLRRIAAAAVEHFGFVRREIFALAVCDFVARALPAEAALDSLVELAAAATVPEALCGVVYGLDLLWRQAPAPEGPEREEIERVAHAVHRRIGLLRSAAQGGPELQA